MADERTETTELAVAFGLLNIHPSETDYRSISTRFEGTLTGEKFQNLKNTLRDSTVLRNMFDKLFELGVCLKRARPDLFPDSANVRWVGPVQQSRSVTVSQDLVYGTTSISVKAESRVVFNLSPYNLFVSLPQGRVFARGGPNWFLRQAPEAYQRLFEVVSAATVYASVEEFERLATQTERKALQRYCAQLSKEDQERFKERYYVLCHETAKASAEEFRRELSASLESLHAAAVLDELLRRFLRLDSSHYVLCGLDRGVPFAYLIPSITDWKRHAELAEVSVEPDLEAQQSKVRFNLSLRVRRGDGRVQVPFHAEIRWSHGRFCGNPEAKLYRDFNDWSVVPGIVRIL